MTIINSFLQKKKLREFSHGMYMVFAAYVLSVLLLIIGSDTLYNIKSKADGVNTQSDEVNQVTLENEVEQAVSSYKATEAKTNSYKVENRMDYLQKYNIQYQESIEVSNDTNWLLGYSMNDEEYGRLMDRMNESEVFAEDNKEVITSFSTDTLSTSTNNTAIVATKDEIQMLEQIVEAEATGEDMIGKILVANVIFNRMADDEFPDNVKGVIFQKVGGEYQFSPIADKRFWSVKVTAETKEAVQRALDGEDHSEGALYFMARKLARKSSAKWFDNNLQWLFKHGGHEFFR